MKDIITWGDFEKIDIRIGTIVSAETFKEAQNPSYKLKIDFGILGIKKSSAQLKKLYKPSDLVGKQIVAIVNFPPKQIATIISECLVLGAIGNNDEVTLLGTERSTKNGSRVG